MPKKVRVVRREQSPSDPDRTPETYESCALKSGATVTVGDRLLVKHRSGDGRWQEAELKRITWTGTAYVFHFYISPPGSISVHEDRIKVITKKKIRIKNK